MPDTEEPFATLNVSEIEQISMPALSVNVDFNDLATEHGLSNAYVIVSALKDLLR